jgi:autotransporter-associated beta strand protein
MTNVTGAAANVATSTLNFTGGSVILNGAILRTTTTGTQNTTLILDGAVLDMVNNAIGSSTAKIGSGSGTIAFKSGTLKNVAEINGGDALVKTTAGTLIMEGNNTYTGGTNINGGILQVNSANALGTTGTISFGGGTLQYTANNTTDYSNRFSTAAGQAYSIDTNGQDVTYGTGLTSSTGTVTKLGAGRLIFTAASTYAGSTTVNQGSLQIGNGTSGSISSSSAVSTAAAGTLSINLANNGTFSNNVANSGTVNANGANTNTLSGVISGGGGFTQTGTGTTILSNANLYTGSTSINSGVLSVTGSLSKTAVTVNGGGKLSGTGTIGVSGASGGGSVTVVGSAAPSSRGSIGMVNGSLNTLTLDAITGGTALTLGSGGQQASLAFEIGASNSSDTLVIGSGAFVDATTGGAVIDITGLSGAGIGTYNLITFDSGNKSGFSNLSLGTLTGLGGGGWNFALQETSTAWQLAVTQAAAGATAYWRGDQSGTWNTITNGFTNWYTDATGTTNTALPGAVTDVVFTTDNSAGNYSTTLGADVSIKSLSFRGTSTPSASNSVTIAGSNTLTVGAGGINVDAGSAAHTISSQVALGTNETWTNNSTTGTFTVSGVVSDGGNGFALTTAGAGTVALAGANTYTGATIVSAGTLQLGNGGATGSISTTSTISVATGATFAVNESAAVSQGTDFIGTGSGISGAGSFAQTGSGSTTLNGSNTYTGTTTVSNGQVHLTGNLTSTSAVTVSESAGTLGTYNASTNTFAGQNAAVLSANDNVTLGSASSTVTVGGAGAVGILAPGGSLGADNGSLTISHDLVVSSGSMLNLGITTPTVAAPTSFVFANGQYYLSSDASFTNGYSNVQNLITDNGNATPPAANTAVATETNIVPASGNHDYINVAGTLTLNSGSMVHVFANGTPSFTYGEVFNVLDWTTIINNGFNNPATFTTGGATGDFYLPDLSLASSGLAWDTSAFTTYGILVVVPEPSRVLLLLFGLLGLALRRRRSAR